jgi:arylformamidase
MKVYDISMTIDENMPVYKNREEKKPKITVVSNFNTGNCYESELCMNLHTGTHIDMPLHMLPKGASSEEFDISTCIEDCMVLDFTHITEKITYGNLQEKKFVYRRFILLKTKNSFSNSFNEDFIYLDESGAAYLKELQVMGVGIDALGIERSQPGHPTHKILLGNGITIIEGLRLADVPEGSYRMLALPLRINRVEALPARIVLLEDDIY